MMDVYRVNPDHHSMYLVKYAMSNVRFNNSSILSIKNIGMDEGYYFQCVHDPNLTNDQITLPAWLWEKMDMPISVNINVVPEDNPNSKIDLVTVSYPRCHPCSYSLKSIEDIIKRQLLGQIVSTSTILPVMAFGTLLFLHLEAKGIGFVTNETKFNFIDTSSLCSNPIKDEELLRLIDILSTSKANFLNYFPRIILVPTYNLREEGRVLYGLREKCPVIIPPLHLLFEDSSFDQFQQEQLNRLDLFATWIEKALHEKPAMTVIAIPNYSLLPMDARKVLINVLMEKLTRFTKLMIIIFTTKSDSDRLQKEIPKAHSTSRTWDPLRDEEEYWKLFFKERKHLNEVDAQRAWKNRKNQSSFSDIGQLVAPNLSSWDHIYGYDEIKRRFKELVYLGTKNPELLQRMGLNPIKGILLYGPSGCGKSELIKAIANDNIFPVIQLRYRDVLSKYLGESEFNLRKVFQKARQLQPCILALDNIELLGAKRGYGEGSHKSGIGDRLLSTLLNELDGIVESKGVLIIGCTNNLEALDEALIRPGRLDHLLNVTKPNPDDLIAILKGTLKRLHIENVNDSSLMNLSSYFQNSPVSEIIGRLEGYATKVFYGESDLGQSEFTSYISK